MAVIEMSLRSKDGTGPVELLHVTAFGCTTASPRMVTTAPLEISIAAVVGERIAPVATTWRVLALVIENEVV